MTDENEKEEILKYERERVARWRAENPEHARRLNKLSQARWRKSHPTLHKKRTRERVRRLRAREN
jgi:hypothetical protein